ncbi:MAG: ABC transporter ATP-binding protein [Rhabdochlamydiaceae bacterium]|nr:ABC transporter ATP-binding protein [Candidatus Amphrikana amoebophyrae]
MNEKVVELKNISKTFHQPHETEILSNVCLTVHKGETIAISGLSGEGKSTLLHLIGLLEAPTSGDIFYGGKSYKRSSLTDLRREYIGFIFQGFYLLEEETVLSNVLMPAKIAKRPTGPKSDAYKRCIKLLDEVGLSDRIDYPAKLLSGGEKQRVAIVRAFCNDPPLILADEPTGNLDQTHSEAIQNLLINCCKKLGKSLILVTHDHSFADLCEKQYYLKNKTI